MRGPSRLDRLRARDAGSPLAKAFTQDRFRLIGTGEGRQAWRCLDCDTIVTVVQAPGTTFGEWWITVRGQHPVCPRDTSWN